LPRLVTVARAATGRLAHFPDVVRLGDGRILATYREGAGHVSPEGRICVVESADAGESWGEPRVVVDGPYDDRDPKLARLADGTVLLSYFVIDWSTRNWSTRNWSTRKRHTVTGTYVRRSDDGGRTWGGAVTVGSAMAGDGRDKGWACSHGAVAELPTGDLLIPLYGQPKGRKDQQATVVRSTDGGRNWPAAGEVVVARGDGIHFQEPTLTVLDGQLVMLIRTTAEHAYLARSTDDGRTWTAPAPTDLPASSHHALALSSGEVLVTYGDLSTRFSPHRETVGRLIRHPVASWDGHPDVQLYDSGHKDQANPSSVEVTPGRLLTLGFDVRAGIVVGVFSEPGDYP
jgi:hypothetical protein